MNREEYTQVLRALELLLSDLYVHTLGKEARLGVRFRERVGALRERVESGADPATDESHNWNVAAGLVADLRDHHTRLSRTGSGLKYLPFALERVSVDGAIRFVVTRVAVAAGELPFVAGDFVTEWDGAPIEAAIVANATHYWGASDAAYLAQGLRFLTHRPIYASAEHDDGQVVVRYEDSAGRPGSATLAWRAEPSAPRVSSQNPSIDAAERSLVSVNEAARAVGRLHRQARRPPRYVVVNGNFGYEEALSPSAPDCGYLRVWDFEVVGRERRAEFFHDLGRVLAAANAARKRWLVIDLRDNPGGAIEVADKMLAAIAGTSLGIKLQFRASPLTQRITALPGEYSEWAPSIDAALDGFGLYSQARLAYPNEPLDMEHFSGQLALLINGCTESAAEMLAARFADENLGVLFGTDATTAGSGSNPLTYLQLQRLLADDAIVLDDGLPVDLGRALLEAHFVGAGVSVPDRPLTVGESVYWYLNDGSGQRRFEVLYLPFVSTRCLLVYDKHRPKVLPDLPDDINLSVSFRRSTRDLADGELALEDRGVVVDRDKRIELTVRDVLGRNEDLRDTLANRLAAP